MQKSIGCWTTLLGTLLLLGMLAAMPLTRLQAQDSPPIVEPAAQLFGQGESPVPPFTPGVVLVGLQGDVVAAAATWGDIEVLAVEPLDLRTGQAAAASDGTPTAESVSGYKLTVPLGTEWGAIDSLLARDDVLFAEPDWLAQVAQTEAQAEPDFAATEIPFTIPDTLYREQWYLQRIGISRAWATALAATAGVLNTVDVTVIDTGVDFNHPDLANRLASGHNYLNSNATAMDDHGHGTHISGLIAAAANNAGMVGTGWEVEITPFKALNNRGFGGVSGIANAIRDAADDGTDIINMSLELPVDSSVLRPAVEYAISKGVLLIAASGNRGLSAVSYPAAYPSVMAVGATTYSDVRATYSNKGPELDIVAPGGGSGTSILSAWTRDPKAFCASGLRQVNGGLYCQVDGTSMATGVATGVAALIMSLRPDLDADEVQEILLDSAYPINGSENEVGEGRLDAAAAVRLALIPRLEWMQTPLLVSSLENSAPIIVEFSLVNPSLAPLTVEITPTSKAPWYDVVGPHGGEASYGEPLDVQLIYTPTAVGVGNYAGSLRVTAFDEDGGETIYSIATSLSVNQAVVGDAHMYMAWAGSGSGTFMWAAPTYTGRINYAISGDDSIVVDLPFSMTIGGRTYSDLRIFADGFVVASASAFPANLPNHCLANQNWPSFSVYGWWSDLGIGTGSTVSTFQPDAQSFVVEYANLVSAGSSDPDDRVSFQIVLHKGGQIELNYGRVPEHTPSNLTIGASAVDGRFYNQITCYTAGLMRLGEVPQAKQTIRFLPEDLY